MRWTALASRQAGVVSRAQLFAFGLTPSQVDGLVRRNRLEGTPWRGVYRVVGAPHSREALRWAAVLGSDGVLSYVTAGLAWGLPIQDDGRLHISRRSRRRLDMPPGVRVHRTLLREDAVTDLRGRAITTQCETVLDCLGWIAPRAAQSLADRSLQQRWIERDDIRWRLDNQPGRWGNQRLRWLLDQSGSGAKAESERILHRLLTASGVCGWVASHAVFANGHRYELDVAFPQRRVAIEVDGWAYHSAPERFVADRRRQNDLVGSGWTILRVTWSDLQRGAPELMVALGRVLAA